MISPFRVALKASIPAKSAGRLVDALTDVIRPFTERMGLKADLIRMQREEVAYEVAVRAARRISLERLPVTPVPTKTLVRLLEAASLEEPSDQTMINLWANLLASSAMREESNVPRYVSILSDINARQARLIQDLFTRRGRLKGKIDGELLGDDLWSVDRAGVMLKLRQELTKITIPRIMRVVRDHVDIYGVAVSDIIVNRGEEQWDSNRGLFPVDENIANIQALESLGLVRDATFKNEPIGPFELSVFLYKVTALCIEMFSACNPDVIARHDDPATIKARRRHSR